MAECFHNDEPIFNFDDDAIGMHAIVNGIVSAVESANPEKSAYVIGLSGCWGSGKSSVVNLVENELLGESDGPTVCRFNPWMFQDERSLLFAFFDTLAGAISQHRFLSDGDDIEAVKQEAKDQMLKYAASVAYPSSSMVAAAFGDPEMLSSVFGAGVASFFVKAMARIVAKKLGSAERDLERMKKSLDGRLRGLKGNIVVIVDDLDRLSDDEICLMFKLVALTASFPRVVYLLSYDRRIVDCALSGIQRCGQSGYLDKIIQLPIEMPRFPVDAKERLIRDAVGLAFSGGSFARGDEREQRRYISILHGVVLPCMRVPRDCRRYSGLLAMNKSRVGDEICPADLLGMTAIEAFLPEVYSWLWSNSAVLLGKNGIAWSDRNSFLWGKRTELGQIIEGSDHAELGVDALLPLFPELFRDKDNFHSYSMEGHRAKICGRVCDERNLALFYGIDSRDSLGRTDVFRMVNEMGSSEVVAAMGLVDDAEGSDDVFGIIADVEDLIPTVEEGRLAVLIDAVFVLLRGAHRVRFKGIVIRSEAEALTRLLERMAKAIGVGPFSNEVKSRISLPEYSAIEGMAYLIRDENLKREKGRIDEPVLTDEAFRSLCSAFTTSVRNDIDNVLEQAKVAPFLVWEVADSVSKHGYYDEFLASIGKDRERLVLCWALRLSESYALDSGLVSYRLYGECPVVVDDFKALRRERIDACSFDMLVRVSALYKILTSDGELVSRQCAETSARAWRDGSLVFP